MLKSKFKAYIRTNNREVTWQVVDGYIQKWYDKKHDYTFYFGLYKDNHDKNKWTIIDLKSGKAFLIRHKSRKKTIEDCIYHITYKISDFDYIKYEIESSFELQLDDFGVYEYVNLEQIARLKNTKSYESEVLK